MAVKLIPEQRKQKKQQHRCEQLVSALEVLADSREQIAVALEASGMPLLPTGELSKDQENVLQQRYQEWLDHFKDASRKVDKAMCKAVRAGLDTYPYERATCEQPQPHDADACNACRWNSMLYELSRLGVIGYPLTLRAWIVTGLALRRQERPFRTLRDRRPDLEREMREPPISKHDVALAEEWCRLKYAGLPVSTRAQKPKSDGAIFNAVKAMRKRGELEDRKQNNKESLRKWAHGDRPRTKPKGRLPKRRLCTKAIPRKLHDLVRRIAPPESMIVHVVWPEADEDYHIAVVVPDGIPYDEVRQLEAHLLRALAAYDYQESDKDHYPLTICRVWREREWRASPEQMQAEEKQVEKLAIQGATLQEALEQFHPALQVKKDLKKRAAMRRAAMLSLLDYSAKKEQMLQDYCAQLEPQIETGEPWDDAQTWTILTGEVEVLIRDTLQLYHDLVRADEFHHYCAATQAQYPYVQSDAQLEALFHKLRELLEKEIALAAQCAHHGYAPKGQADLVECIRAVEVLLADESPIYTSEPFQAALQQSLDDVKAGRVVEMTPEQL